MAMREPTGAEASARIEAAKALLDAHATMSLAGCDGDRPWVTRVFFVEDEPASGSFDMCCTVIASTERLDAIRSHPRVSFIIAGDEPDRWVTGHGTAEVIADEAESAAVLKRLHDKAPSAGSFLDAVASTALRVHVERLRMTDLDADPPVAEFTFDA